MSVLDSFYFLFDSDTSKLDKGLEHSEKKTDSLIDKLKDVDKEGGKAGSALHGLIGKTAGIIGVGLSIGALIAGVKESAAAYEALSKLADEFRSTATAMQEFTDVAKLVGLSEDEAAESLKALDGVMQKAMQNTDGAGKTFKELGVSLTDADGKARSTTDVMNELATAMQGMDEQQRLAITDKLGLDGPALKMFTADALALQKRVTDLSRASGLNLEEATKRSKEFTKASKAMGTEFDILKMYIDKISEKFKMSSMPIFTKAMETATKYVRMFTEYLMDHSKFVEGVFIAIGAAIAYFMLPAAISGAVAVWAMIAPFVAVGAAAAAVGLVFALVYDDIMNFIDGGDSMIGEMVNRWPIIGEIASSIGDAFKALWDIGVQLMDFMIAMWDDPAAAFSNFFSMIVDGIKSLLNMIPGLSTAMGALGFGGDTAKGVAAGKDSIGAASATPMASSSSSSISNSKSSKSTSVNVGKVEVKTQATDAAGISKAIGGSMETQMRQAANNFDDGLLA